MKEKQNKDLELSNHTLGLKGLSETLNAKTGEDLKSIGNMLFVRGLSSKKKKQLVEIIGQHLTSVSCLTRVIQKLNREEFDGLRKIISHDGMICEQEFSIESYYYLCSLGIISPFEIDQTIYVSMPDEVLNTMKQISFDQFEKMIDQNTITYHLLQAMIELYGIVSYDDFENAYHSYYKKTSEEDFRESLNCIKFTNRLDLITCICIDNIDYYVNEILLDEYFEDILENIMTRQKEIPKKEMKLEEILQYKDDYYEETKFTSKLKHYLNGKVKSSDIENVMINMNTLFKIGMNDIQTILDMLEEYQMKIEEKNLQTLLDHVMDVYNNTRLWTNHGWTPTELRNHCMNNQNL